MSGLSPEVLALVLADAVHHDDVSGKLFILGTRAEIEAAEFPYRHPRLAAYVALVEGRGEMLLRIRLIDSDEELAPLAIEESVVSFDHPLAELQVVAEFTDVEFPEPGDYRLQLYVDGQFLRERRIIVSGK